MPAKQVYGKRAPAKTITTYAKFISPDKDGVVLVGGEKAKSAAKTSKTKSRRSEDELKEVEKDLERLDLGGEEAEVVITKVAEKKSRPPRTKNVHNELAKAADNANLTKEMDALTLDEDKENGFEDKMLRKRGRPRKGIKSDKGLLETDKEAFKLNSTQHTQTARHPKESKRQSISPVPVRGRRLKAVVIPIRRSQSGPSHLPTPDPTPEPEDLCTAYVSSLLSLSYGKKVTSFAEWSSSLEPHFEVAKIAEASFSEVYRLSATSTTFDSTNESVLKLIALKTPPNAPLRSSTQARGSRDPERQAKKDLQVREEKDQWKSHVEDVHSEVTLLQNLNHIPGFTNFREVTVLQGRPSGTFVDAWKAWNKIRPKGRKSEFPDPSRKPSYDDSQLWAVIEMQDAGTDCEKAMESGGLSTVWEVWDVFWGVCLSIAKAEETCNFEHRDLHLGNICVRSSRSQSDGDLTTPVIRDPLRRKLKFTGLDTTVIDYTLSRADILAIPASGRVSSSSETSALSSFASSTPPEPEVAYLDLNKDMGLFEGDASEEYQYEIYRYMRGVVLTNNPLKSSPPSPSINPATTRRSPRKLNQHIVFDDDGRDPTSHSSIPRAPADLPPSSSSMWKPFHPKTNLVWAHFVLHKLLHHLSGHEPSHLSSEQVMQSVEAKPEDTQRIFSRACKLHKILQKVSRLLDPEVLGEKDALGSVKELVVLAMEERWLRVEDVAGC